MLLNLELQIKIQNYVILLHTWISIVFQNYNLGTKGLLFCS